MFLEIIGKAGTGKSHVLKEFKKLLGPKTIFCCQTGKAAVNVGGMTINSTFKISFNTFY